MISKRSNSITLREDDLEDEPPGLFDDSLIDPGLEGEDEDDDRPREEDGLAEVGLEVDALEEPDLKAPDREVEVVFDDELERVVEGGFADDTILFHTDLAGPDMMTNAGLQRGVTIRTRVVDVLGRVTLFGVRVWKTGGGGGGMVMGDKR